MEIPPPRPAVHREIRCAAHLAGPSGEEHVTLAEASVPTRGLGKSRAVRG
ncbi:hypothetical protein [Streptomyces sp. NPDC059080]